MINTVKIQGNGYLVDGGVYVPKDENNRHYQEIKKFIEDGGNVEDEFTPEETQKQITDNFVIMTDAHIQAEVNKYNEDNNVMFGSIHNCSTYVTVDTYPHQAFCIAIIQWNADIWETVRAFQASATTIPTDEEFKAVLDGVHFDV